MTKSKKQVIELFEIRPFQNNTTTFYEKRLLRKRRGRVRTTLQSMMNAKLCLHGFWHCHENGVIKTIQTIPHNIYVSFKLASLYCGLRLILVYPNS